MKLKRVDLVRGVQIGEATAHREVLVADDGTANSGEVVEVSREERLILLIPRDNVVSMTPE